MPKRSHSGFSPVVLAAATAALVAIVFADAPAHAEPKGGHVVGGAATIQGQGTSSVTINQSTPGLIINWQSFNIGVGEAARFNQPGTSSVALNRVTGDKSPSSILGTLSANGRVFLVNPEGFIFGPSARINTAGFLATTHDIKNEDFLAGRYNFSISGNPKASIVNQGTITVTDAGIAALVAPAVRNDGVITARLGKAILASSNAFTLDLYGDNLISFALNDEIASQVIDVATGKTVASLVENRGTLTADGGTVAMTAVTARALVDSVINNTGVIEARSVGMQNGKIVLGGQTAGTKTASSPGQTVAVSGRLDVSGKNKNEIGGKVHVTGERIALAGAVIDASGNEGGGTVLMGGDVSGGKANPALAGNALAQPGAQLVPTATSVSVDAATIIDASAKTTGNGGKVVIWSDGSTSFVGTIKATAGMIGGDGGFVETSGYEQLSFDGKVDLSAANGRTGTLLLDPKDVTIGSSGSWIVTVEALQAALATNNVIVNTSASGTDAGDIKVAESVSWAGGNTLTLSALRHIAVADGVTIANTGTGNLVMRADDTGSGTGRVTFNGTGKVDFAASTGSVSIFYNPTWFRVPIFCEDSCAGAAPAPAVPRVLPIPVGYTSKVVTNAGVPNQLTAYMLVNDIDHLLYIHNSLSGTYALGRDIDASATASWNGGAGFVPIGTFSGLLDGQGHTITGLHIKGSNSDVGLFGRIAASGEVRRLGLVNVSVSGSIGYQGGLAAANEGIIDQVFVTGTVSTDAINTTVGGLVGINIQGGLISRSYSMASVSGGPGSSVGGFAGWNNGTISESYSTGSPFVAVVTPTALITNSLVLTASAAQAGLPAGFSTAVWGQSSTFNGGFPYLLWQLPTAPSATTLTGGPLTQPPVTLFYVANPATTVYGSLLPPLTGTVTGFVNGDTLATATTGTLTFTTLATSSSDVGSYAITGSGLTAIGNYVFSQAPANSIALTISPASLVITANNATRTVGQSNPPFTATIAGLVLGQTPSIVSGLTFTTPATTTSLPGTYPIVPGGASAPNYQVVYGKDGVLTISRSGQVAAAAAADTSGVLSIFLESIRTGLLSQIPWFFSTPYKLATSGAAVAEFLQTVSARNRFIMDETIKPICGQGPTCSASAIAEAADELSNYPFMGAGNIRSALSVAEMTTEQHQDYVRQITAERAKQLGYVID
jgi:filamentous hemagglutinin family protein